jgi:Tol biopolymer transport system component
MTPARRLLAITLLALGAALGLPSAAAAEFGAIELLSKTPAQQAGEALAPAISADGRYLAFQGIVGARGGVFREDLASGAIVGVATTSAAEPQAGQYATAPSISADGRYVSFTTKAPLDPGDDSQPASSDVYVADMAPSPPRFELASALDGCDPENPDLHAPCGLTYGGSGGSEASGRVALSADGREVVFVTSASSNLTSGPEGSTPGEPTPPLQVVLRDLEDDSTTLVSVERDAETGMTAKPVPGGALVGVGNLPLLRGAALSADGTTVAWIGTHLPAQVSLSPVEAEAFATLDASSFPYDEPLWRRIADGPSTPIRRVVGGDGGADPFPDMTGKSTELPNLAQGWLGAESIDGVPQLSADGRSVALIGNPTEAANAFLVDMAPGLSRVQAVRQLTREVVVNPANLAATTNKPPYIALTGHVFDLAIAPDGRKVAFVTARQRFPLAPPNLIGQPPTGVGLAELYSVDLEDGTLERVSHGVAGPGEASLDAQAIGLAEGSPVQHGDGAGSPSFGDGGLLAFASTASNLIAGDSNEASDAFLVRDVAAPDGPGETTISPGPAGLHPRRGWRLALSALSLADGSVRLVATVPAAGTLRASAGPEPGGTLQARRIAGAAARASAAGRVTLELRLPASFRRLARTPEGVYAMARVSFHHGGRKTLRARLQVRFHVHERRAQGGGRR